MEKLSKEVKKKGELLGRIENGDIYKLKVNNANWKERLLKEPGLFETDFWNEAIEGNEKVQSITMGVGS